MRMMRLTEKFFEDIKVNKEFFPYVERGKAYELIEISPDVCDNFDARIGVPGASIMTNSVFGFINWGDTVPVKWNEIEEVA